MRRNLLTQLHPSHWVPFEPTSTPNSKGAQILIASDAFVLAKRSIFTDLQLKTTNPTSFSNFEDQLAANQLVSDSILSSSRERGF